ncbi:MAG TPA: 6-phosphofructokinase, partial [Fimbriimonadaceae bacterium]|nr:6-phosphofructokinase [Fimbriimonadaceae bacterium]
MDRSLPLKKIAVVTSGGDAPGMNAAVRAVVRSALVKGAQVLGFAHGYRGIIGNEVREMTSKSVGGIVSQGGTILHTARSPEFKKAEGRKQAHDVLIENGAEGLIVIGGDGSLAGAKRLCDEFDFP